MDHPDPKIAMSPTVEPEPEKKVTILPQSVGETVVVGPRYPSQMNKEELVAFGNSKFSLGLNIEMPKRDLYNAVADAMEEAVE
jgi:hypothetical protein